MMEKVIKIPNFITVEECDEIIEQIKAFTGPRFPNYGVGKSYGENPLDMSPEIKEILWEKIKLIFGRRAYVQCWVNVLQPGMLIPPHVHREPGLNPDGTFMKDSHYFKEKHPFRCTNLFLGGPEYGTRYNGVTHESNRGELHIFSSDLEHSVDKNITGDPRYSLVMDFMVTIGDGDWLKLL